MFNPATLATVIAKAQQNAAARSMSGIKSVKPPPGESRWRILPGWREKDRETFFHSFGRHWVKNPNDLDKPAAVYLCERETYGKPCSICDAIGDAIRSTKDDRVLGQLKELNPERGVLVNAVQVVNGKSDPTKVVLLNLTPSLFERNLLPLISSRWQDEINMLSLEDGRDVIIRKEGTGLMTRYSIADAPKNSSIDADVMNHLIDIDAWLHAEKQRGEMRGTEPLTSLFKSLVGAPPTISGSSSLVSGLAGPTAALLPTHRVLDDSDVVEIEQTAVKSAKTKTVAVEEDELDQLLKDFK